ncbi:MAG TPA: thioredoxin family protein [Verrucomicrobiae bacterium]|jgi:predicted dithiol-disulfide oxidoreductase (DUF899 family)
MSTNAAESELKNTTAKHKIVSREEWIVARKELLDAEKALTRRSDELARWRQELPWVRVEKDYRFETDEGKKSLVDLFGGRSQLIIYHFMFGPDFKAGCPSCSSIADSFNGIFFHLENHDVGFYAVSRAPLAKLQAYKRRMGWSFRWASSFNSDFNYDFQAGHTEEQEKSGAVEYNFRMMPKPPPTPVEESPWMTQIASGAGTNWATFKREMPGMSAFALENGTVYHTYSAYARGLDALWAMYQWLDRAPFGRNDNDMWVRRHDEYKTPAPNAESCCSSEEEKR